MACCQTLISCLVYWNVLCLVLGSLCAMTMTDFIDCMSDLRFLRLALLMPLMFNGKLKNLTVSVPPKKLKKVKKSCYAV